MERRSGVVSDCVDERGRTSLASMASDMGRTIGIVARQPRTGQRKACGATGAGGVR